MQLKTVRVTNFRCVLDSNTFRVDDVTCLVGKNESGKTTILQALRALKPYERAEIEYNNDLDYPRAYKFLHGEGAKSARVLETTWELEDQDVAAFEDKFGPDALSSREFATYKKYGDESCTIDVKFNEGAVVGHLAKSAGVTEPELGELKKIGTTKGVIEYAASKGQEASPELAGLKTTLAAFSDSSAKKAAINFLYQRMPKFLYFGAYDQMNGNVALTELQQQVANNTVSEENRVFLAFLNYAGIPLDQIPKLQNFESLMANVEGASNAITKQVFEYWSQNRFLRVTFQQVFGMEGDPPPFNTGWILRTRVYNDLHEATVNFDDRSTGFVWFFSFLALFSQVEKTHGDVIILLDEPGLSLHGRAQGDLQRFIHEKLRPNHQVIYTTHSPFMVPPDNLTSVRTVEDVVEFRGNQKPLAHGTKVREDVLATDADTLFPLQGALGYEITQTLFIGKHTLMVESAGDVLMLQSASAKLKALKREGLDPRWTLCPVGGIGKIMPFVNLFGGANKLDVATLADYQHKDKQEIQRLKESELLKQGRVFTADTFCGQDEADIEDFFGATLYASMVNQTYGLAKTHRITADSIAKAAEKTLRIVKRVQTLFQTMPPQVDNFDHYQPAYWLQQHPELWDEDAAESSKALDRFEAFFKAANALLPSK